MPGPIWITVMLGCTGKRRYRISIDAAKGASLVEGSLVPSGAHRVKRGVGCAREPEIDRNRPRRDRRGGMGHVGAVPARAWAAGGMAGGDDPLDHRGRLVAGGGPCVV